MILFIHVLVHVSFYMLLERRFVMSDGVTLIDLKNGIIDFITKTIDVVSCVIKLIKMFK